MARKRLPPTDPHEWLRRARINLERSRHLLADMDFEDYCFDAQQAAEKAIKAVFIANGKRFQYTHNIRLLLKDLAAAGVHVPKFVLKADRLTRFAVVTRYPGMSPPVTKAKYGQAVRLAERVLKWAERQVK